MSLPKIRLYFSPEWVDRALRMSRKHRALEDPLLGFTNHQVTDDRYAHIPFDWTLNEAQLKVITRFSIREVIHPRVGMNFPNPGVLAHVEGIESAIVSVMNDSAREISIIGTSLHAVREMYFRILAGGEYRVSWSPEPQARTRFFVEKPSGPEFLHQVPYKLEPLPMSEIRVQGHEHSFIVQVHGRGYSFNRNGITIDILVRPANQLSE